MQINFMKSTMYTNVIPAEVLVQMDAISPFSRQRIDEGFKYLGFNLKPNSYGYGDWLWMVKKIQARIMTGAHRWLSRGGRLVLLKLVLSSIPVY